MRLFTLKILPVILSRKLVCNSCNWKNQIFSSHIVASISSQAKIKVMVGEAKKMKTTIGTHNGVFHCDEVLACFMLQQLEQYKNAEIIRTRDNEELEKCDIVVDVGSVFDPTKKRFDHHQRGFKETFSSLRPDLGDGFNIKLSSAGLIYVHFGETVIKNVLQDNDFNSTSPEEIEKLYLKMYKHLIMEVDAIDNGVQICEGTPNYYINSNLSKRVDKFNPSWNQKLDEQAQFEKAKDMVGEEFVTDLLKFVSSWLPACKIVENSVDNATKVHESGEIIELLEPCPWKEHLFELEKSRNLQGKFKYVIMMSKSTDWRVICVPVEPQSFKCRKFLPESWRGIRDEQLKTVSGVSDAHFCHANGFIGGATSREGALKMAVESLKT